MSLLMDALRKAEAEKKLAAGQPLPPESRAMLDDTREIAPAAPAESMLEDSREIFSLEPMTPGAAAAAAAEPIDELPKLEDYFDDSEPADFLRTRPPFSTTTRDNLAQALGQTVVNAQTVFDAGGRATTNWILGATIAITVLLAMGLAAAGFFYLQKTPVVKAVPSPLVANAVEKPVRATVPAKPPVPLAARESVAPPAPIEAIAKPATTEPPSVPIVAAPAPPPAVKSSQPKAIAAPKVPALDPDAEIAGGEVRIARTKPRSGELTETLKHAYAAYAAGRDPEAERLYREVLALRPDQKDALLGLGAIALRAGKLDAAHAAYSRVRKLDPDNPAAAAALFMIEGGGGTQVTESQLKLLLDRGLDVPPLHFALGNYYAREGRWADAQQSYFEAYSRNHANADYAYNLGVALDRLGQRAAALDYYRKALDLAAAGGRAAFDRAQVAARIEALDRAE